MSDTRRRFSNSQAGFSLIEILVAMTIFAVIVVAALLVYDRSNRVFKSGVEAADMQQNTRVAFDKVVGDVRLAGFDHDRDGKPTALNQEQQPDEQLEYAGPHAITLRANFNYTEAGTDGGRVKLLETGPSPDGDPTSKFPIVTTSNDEIVTYALVPDTPGATTQTLTFYADVTDGSKERRQAFPGGSAEDKIDITGVDLCATGCNQPPYTLYRFTVTPTGTVNRTPLASNIRTINFEYYTDILGTTPLTITDPGGGKYDPNSPASLNATGRTERSQVRAIRVRLVGMNAANDFRYTQPGETIASAKNKRQYPLESLVVSRNLGKHGMREQQTSAPGTPKLVSAGFNYCSVVKLTWEPPAANPSFGDVETYYVLFDSDTSKTDPATDPPIESRSVGLATTAYIKVPDPTIAYRFSVAATNSWGTAYSTEQLIGTPKNGTKPDAPTGLLASGGSEAGAPPLVENKIVLQWTPPTTNVTSPSGLNQESLHKTTYAGGGVTTVGPVEARPEEWQGFEIHRGTDKTFTPTAATLVGIGKGTSFVDTSAGNCKTYYYRIRVLEYCAAANNQNTTNDKATAVSDYYPPVGSDAISGYTESDIAPEKPGPLVVSGTSACSGGNCTVNMSWPAVKTDVNDNQVSIIRYDIEVLQTGPSGESPVSGSPFRVELGAGLTEVDNVVSFTKVVEEKHSTGVAFSYRFRARAVNCDEEGDWSEYDAFPKCKFGGASATLAVNITGAHDGSGSAVDPWVISADELLSFSISSGANIAVADTTVYNIANGQQVGPLVNKTTLPAATVLFDWASEVFPEGEVYRVDYVLTDTQPTPCKTSGSVYISAVSVGCPFGVPVTFTETFAAPPNIKFSLNNPTQFDATFVKAEITWNENAAGSADNNFGISSVTLPAVSGSGTVNATLTNPTGNDGVDVKTTASSTGAQKIFAGILNNSYVVTVNFSANKPFTANPIKKIDIFYLLPGDTSAEVKSCTVYP